MQSPSAFTLLSWFWSWAGFLGLMSYSGSLWAQNSYGGALANAGEIIIEAKRNSFLLRLGFHLPDHNSGLFFGHGANNEAGALARSTSFRIVFPEGIGYTGEISRAISEPTFFVGFGLRRPLNSQVSMALEIDYSPIQTRYEFPFKGAPGTQEIFRGTVRRQVHLLLYGISTRWSVKSVRLPAVPEFLIGFKVMTALAESGVEQLESITLDLADQESRILPVLELGLQIATGIGQKAQAHVGFLWMGSTRAKILERLPAFERFSRDSLQNTRVYVGIQAGF